MDFINNHWTGIIALFALLTSIVNTLILFRTFKLQRNHNIKSVKPIIHIGQWDYENRLLVTLKNCGSGIAIVKKMEVCNKKSECKTCLYDWLPSKLPDKMNYKEYWTPYNEFIVQAGEIIKLIEIPIDTNSTIEVEMREKLRSILRQLTVRVIYEDIYGNIMPTKEMELHHFSRTDNVN